jgi:magnesium transporter
MKVYFEIKDGALVECPQSVAKVLVYAMPDAAEKQEILEQLPFDQYALESALDPDEISRVEFAPDYTYIIWKRPNNATFEQLLRFEVSSVGLFLQRGRLAVILSDSNVPFAGKEFRGVTSPTDVLLRFLLHTVHHYVGHLKVIKQLTRELEQKLHTSMENRYLLQMFAIGESLVYYLSAIEANMSVLSKLRASADKVGFSKEEHEVMDDIVIEHQQCSRQTQIYSSVLSGLMDARGNIINNNMNVMLKNLTLINVVFLPLNLIASIGGMSEFSGMTKGIDWRISYSIFVLAMISLGWLTWFFLVTRMEKSRSSRRQGRMFGR